MIKSSEVLKYYYVSMLFSVVYHMMLIQFLFCRMMCLTGLCM